MNHSNIHRLFSFPDPDPTSTRQLSNRIMSEIDVLEERRKRRGRIWEHLAIAASLALFLSSAAATLPELIGPAGDAVFAAEDETKLYELVTQDRAFDPLEMVDLALHTTAR